MVIFIHNPQAASLWEELYIPIASLSVFVFSWKASRNPAAVSEDSFPRKDIGCYSHGPSAEIIFSLWKNSQNYV